MSTRRRFLRGAAGVALGLPFLESLEPAFAATPARTKRFVVFFQACGVDVKRFWPKTLGRIEAGGLDGSALAPLTDLRGKLLVMRGLHGSPRGHGRDVGVNDHSLGTNSRLTAAGVAGGLADGISVDQEIAKAINPNKRPGLTAAVSRRGQGDSRFVSFTGPRQPAPVEDSPWKIYESLTGLGGSDPAVAQRILARRQSVLDVVKGQFDDLKASPRLGKADRDKLDLHFTSVRDIEVKAAAGCKLADETVAEVKALGPDRLGTNDAFEAHTKLLIDVVALAVACGHTNVATLMTGAGANTSVYTALGHTHEHHLISHRVVAYSSGSALGGAEDMLHAIDLWHAKQFRDLVGKLDADEDVGGTILDNSVVLWTNELSEGKAHHYRDLPFVVAGSGGGYFKQGLALNLSQHADPLALGNRTLVEDRPHNKLLTSFCNAMGLRDADGGPVKKFGRYGLPGEYDEIRA